VETLSPGQFAHYPEEAKTPRESRVRCGLTPLAGQRTPVKRYTLKADSLLLRWWTLGGLWPCDMHVARSSHSERAARGRGRQRHEGCGCRETLRPDWRGKL
jgi:hypothetical protein